MTEFQISKNWTGKKGGSELDATLAKLKIVVADKNVSEFREADGETCDHLHIPAYFIAEWIAENWWPLLWEPRKSEDGSDDAGFLARHSLLHAQHGFALPKVSFVPAGGHIFISAIARESNLADVRFKNTATASLTRDVVEKELRSFVQSTCDRLAHFQMADTGLQQAWRAVTEIEPDEQEFCQLAGALGLSPNEVSDKMADLLERLSGKLGDRLLMDLCLVAPPDFFAAVASSAEAAFDGLASVPDTDLKPLLAAPVPADNLAVPAWRRGVQAAQQLRRKLNINDTDPRGATKVFESLGLDVSRHGNHFSSEVALTGAVSKASDHAQIALLQPAATQRRFAAARAIFVAWTADRNDKRFLTSAVTRDQQANRAFAAELTAPHAFIRARAKNLKLSQNQVFDLAAELEIGSDVVSKQALNRGLQVTAY